MVSRAILNGWPLVPPSRQWAVPAFTVAPSISGIALPGQTLTLNPATVTGWPSPAVTVQWTRNGSNIPGATGLTYTSTDADNGVRISARVWAANVLGVAIAHATGVNIADLRDFAVFYGSASLSDNDATILIDSDGAILIEAA